MREAPTKAEREGEEKERKREKQRENQNGSVRLLSAWSAQGEGERG